MEVAGDYNSFGEFYKSIRKKRESLLEDSVLGHRLILPISVVLNRVQCLLHRIRIYSNDMQRHLTLKSLIMTGTFLI